MLDLTRKNSSIIKGIVIMMMVFYHLFNGSHMHLHTPLLYIGQVPMATWLAAACWPVSFFLILSGYGLATKQEQGGISTERQLSRVLRIYMHYWVVLAIFVPICMVMMPDVYPGGIKKLVANVLAWNTTYNSEMWFLLPYSVLSVLSLYIIRGIERLGNLASLVITTLIYTGTSFLISRCGHFLFTHMWAYQPLLCIHLLQAFTMGVVLRRTSLPLSRPCPQWGIVGAIIILVLATCIKRYSFSYLVYVPLLVILLAHVHWPGWMRAVLTELGNKSMPIWMIHTWLAYYLFQPQVYSLKYAPLIFIAVMVACYLISIPVMWIASRLYNLLPLKK